LLLSKKLLQEAKGEDGRTETVDIGFVGDVVKVNTDLIKTLENGNYIPVIAPVGVGPLGESYNINADLVAGRVAAALNAEKLILLTDTPGVLDSQKRLLASIAVADMHRLIEEEAITGGMIPKVVCCADALKDGVKKAHIIDGRMEHAVLLEIFTDIGIGTEIIK
jgi:acetylglutamate kinase